MQNNFFRKFFSFIFRWLKRIVLFFIVITLAIAVYLLIDIKLTYNNLVEKIDYTSFWKEYKNETHGLSFKYPPNYKVKEVKEIKSIDRIFNYNKYFLRYDGDLMVTLEGEYSGVIAKIDIVLSHNFPQLKPVRYIATSYNQTVFDYTDFEELFKKEYDNYDPTNREYIKPSMFNEDLNRIIINAPLVYSYHRPWQRIIKGYYIDNENPNIISTLTLGDSLTCGSGVIIDEKAYMRCLEELVVKTEAHKRIFPSTPIPEKSSGEKYHRDNEIWRNTNTPPEIRYFPALIDQILILKKLSYDSKNNFVENILEEYFEFKTSKCRHYNEWKHHGVEACQKFPEINDSKLLGYIEWEQINLLNDKKLEELSQFRRDDIARLVNTHLIRTKELKIEGEIYPIKITDKYKYLALMIEDEIDLINEDGEIRRIFPTGKVPPQNCSINFLPEDNQDNSGEIIFTGYCEGIGAQKKYNYKINSDTLEIYK